MATLKEIFEGNTSKVLEATELLKVLGDRDGQFVWKQLTAEGGDFVAFVTADSEDSYPDGGMQDGYWYELVKENDSLDCGTVTLSTHQRTIPIQHGLGVVPKIALISNLSATTGESNRFYFVYVQTDNEVNPGVYARYSSGLSVQKIIASQIPSYASMSEDGVEFTAGSTTSNYFAKGNYFWMVAL